MRKSACYIFFDVALTRCRQISERGASKRRRSVMNIHKTLSTVVQLFALTCTKSQTWADPRRSTNTMSRSSAPSGASTIKAILVSYEPTSRAMVQTSKFIGPDDNVLVLIIYLIAGFLPWNARRSAVACFTICSMSRTRLLSLHSTTTLPRSSICATSWRSHWCV